MLLQILQEGRPSVGTGDPATPKGVAHCSDWLHSRLFDFEKSEKFALEKTIEKLGFTYNEQDHLRIYHEVNKKIWKEFELGEITQEELKVERFN